MANITDYLNRRYDDTPKQRIGIGGFTALAIVEDKTTRTADIPATPVEDGSFVNDHVIINPVRLSIQGNVSDVYVESSPILDDLKRSQATVGAVTQYLPERTAAQTQQVNAIANDIADAIRAADAVLAAGQQVVRFFGNQDQGSKTNQEQFMDAMDSLYYGKQLISIDTKYRRYNNMVITSLEIRRDNQSNSTNFSIEATEFRFASTTFAELVAAPAPSEGTGGQLDAEAAKGTQEGTPIDSSLLFTVIGR